MQLSSEEVLPVAQAVAWKALNDTEVLKACIPGCESITPAGENVYELIVTAAVGPVKARFKGKMTLADIIAPKQYTIHFEGQGGPAGHGKGNAEVRLEEIGPNETRLSYVATAQVGGKIAQIGSRLVDMAAQKMASDFFGAFNALVQERYGAAPAAAAVPETGGSAWARFMAWLKRLFG